MIWISKYNKATKLIEYRFQGFPHLHTKVIKSLITLAGQETSIVSNISYHELSKLLTVDPAPNRKGAGMPQKETIQSYLRTIFDNCPKDFNVFKNIGCQK